MAVVLIGVQLAYPWNNLPLYTVVDGIAAGNQPVDDIIKKLDERYKNLPLELYFGSSPKPYRQPHPADIGLAVRAEQQVRAKEYTLWLRLVPTSLWWAHAVTGTKSPEYVRDAKKANEYVQKELGKSCDVKPQNATLEYKDKKLKVVPAIAGGSCKLDDVERQLGKATPLLSNHALRVPMKERPPKISDATASQYMKQLLDKTKGVTVKAGDTDVAVPQDTLLAWLDFAAPDSGIASTVNADRSADFFAKQLVPKVEVKPGTSRITTLDFTEISRVNGAPGQALDSNETVKLLNEWLGGADVQLVAKVAAVPPTPVYTRTYSPSDTGLSALITQFAESHKGSFGVSFAELGGKNRRATYNDTKIFRTASTYKLFVAYSTLKRIENGQFHWSDQINGGRDLAKCFDDMIVKSDNACAEALLYKIGLKTISNEMNAIGLTKSTFMHSVPETTAGDLTTFVGALNAGQLLNPDSTNRLLSAMKRNVYRQGIPAGASGQTADKVGFLDGLLHDAAIVYSPSGTYALSIMTDGSSWGTIAELTRQIENLRAQ